jgi:hypothetical protein
MKMSFFRVFTAKYFGIEDHHNRADFRKTVLSVVIVFTFFVLAVLVALNFLSDPARILASIETYVTFLISTFLSLFALFLSGAIAIAQREQSAHARDITAARQHFSDNLTDQMKRIREGLGPISAGSKHSFVLEIYISSFAFGFLDRKETAEGPYYPAMEYFVEMLEEFARSAKSRAENNASSELIVYVWDSNQDHAKSLTSQLKDFIKSDEEFTGKRKHKTIKENLERISAVFESLREINNYHYASTRRNLVTVYLYSTERDDVRFFILENGDNGSESKIQLLLMTPVSRGQGTVTPGLESILLSDQTRGGSRRLKVYAERFIKFHSINSTNSTAAMQEGAKILSTPKAVLNSMLGVNLV